MEVGEPGSGPPQAVLTAAKQALGQLPLGYTEALGRLQLRAASAEHYDQLYGLMVDPGQVVATVGASGAFMLASSPPSSPATGLVVFTDEAAPPAPAWGLPGAAVDHGGWRHA
jgi:aspartate/methionine/tyrosine aminotransferase